jgi:hypothetical protein
MRCLSTLIIAACLASLGCDDTPTTGPVDESAPHAFVLSAELRGDKVVVEKRSLGDDGLSKVKASLELQASSGHQVDLLAIDPSGEFLFACARAEFLQSFPQNQGAVHTVWILRTDPLELVREYALPDITTEPYWVSDTTLRFEVGDVERNCVDHTVESNGTIARTILAEVPPRATSGYATKAAQVLNDRGFRWVAHPGSPQQFRSYLFNDARGNPVVSEDGELIVASVWLESEFNHHVAFLQKNDSGKWEQKTTGIEGFPKIAISGKWLAVASAVGPGFASEAEAPTGELVWNCRFYNAELEMVKGDLTAHAIDIY